MPKAEVPLSKIESRCLIAMHQLLDKLEHHFCQDPALFPESCCTAVCKSIRMPLQPLLLLEPDHVVPSRRLVQSLDVMFTRSQAMTISLFDLTRGLIASNKRRRDIGEPITPALINNDINPSCPLAVLDGISLLLGFRPCLCP